MTAELADLAVDQCDVIEERFTLIAPDDYRHDLLEIKLFDVKGPRARPRVAVRRGTRRTRRRTRSTRGRKGRVAGPPPRRAHGSSSARRCACRRRSPVPSGGPKESAKELTNFHADLLAGFLGAGEVALAGFVPADVFEFGLEARGGRRVAGDARPAGRHGRRQDCTARTGGPDSRRQRGRRVGAGGRGGGAGRAELLLPQPAMSTPQRSATANNGDRLEVIGPPSLSGRALATHVVVRGMPSQRRRALSAATDAGRPGARAPRGSGGAPRRPRLAEASAHALVLSRPSASTATPQPATNPPPGPTRLPGSPARSRRGGRCRRPRRRSRPRASGRPDGRWRPRRRRRRPVPRADRGPRCS